MSDIHYKKRLDLNLLLVFDAVYHEQHLGRAADRLFLTPSAVSHSLRRLRDFFSDPLFERNGRGMQPTPFCQRLAPRLLEALSHLQNVLTQADAFDPAATEQHVTIGLHESMETWLLPLLMAFLRSRAPGIRVSSVRVDRKDIARELGSGRVQLLVDVTLPIRAPIEHQRLIDVDYVVIARKDHPLIGQMTINEYLNANHIVVSTRRNGLAAEDYALQQMGRQRDIGLRCQDYEAAASVVATSDCLLTIPRALAVNLIKPLAAVVVDLPFTMPSLGLDMYWHTGTANDPANQWLRSVILELVNRPGLANDSRL